MKRIKRLLLVLLLSIIPFMSINASCINSDGSGKKGSVSLSASSLSMYVGKSKTFKISAPCAAGKISISSSDNKIATVSPQSDFVDDSSITVTVKGKSAGKVTIYVNLDDVADYARNTLSGSKKVTVTVKNPTTTTKKTTNPTSSKTTSSTTKSTSVVIPEVKEMKINRFEIVGYDINFDINTHEYSIDVNENIKKLYVIVKGEDITVSGDKEVNIEGKNSITISLKSGSETEEYTVNINRISTTTNTQVVTKEVIKEVEVTNNTYLYSSIGLLILCVILVIVILKKAKSNIVYDKKEVDNKITPLENTTIIPTVNPNVAINQNPQPINNVSPIANQNSQPISNPNVQPTNQNNNTNQISNNLQ